MKKRNIIGLFSSALLLIIGVFSISINVIAMFLLVTAAFTINPFSPLILERMNKYWSKSVYVLITIVCVASGLFLDVRGYQAYWQQKNHEHIEAGWEYDYERGYKTERCKECGKIIERVLINPYEP